MALTTAVRMRLQRVNFERGFQQERDVWLEMAQAAYAYAASNVDTPPMQDDVAPHLAIALESREEFIRLRSRRKGTGARYWVRDFADLIVALLWDDLTAEEESEEQDG